MTKNSIILLKKTFAILAAKIKHPKKHTISFDRELLEVYK